MIYRCELFLILPKSTSYFTIDGVSVIATPYACQYEHYKYTCIYVDDNEK